jgi:hypothetical protein
MPLPALPTDSLYKFVALSGILLMLAGIALTGYEQEVLDNVVESRRAEVLGEITSRQRRIAALELEVLRLEAQNLVELE